MPTLIFCLHSGGFYPRQGDSYTLTYSDTQGIKYEFTFHYFPDEGDGGAIRIKNRNETVWVKKKNPEDEDS